MRAQSATGSSQNVNAMLYAHFELGRMIVEEEQCGEQLTLPEGEDQIFASRYQTVLSNTDVIGRDFAAQMLARLMLGRE